MCKKIWAIAKLNLKNIKTPYFVAVLITLAIFTQTVIEVLAARNSGTKLDVLQVGAGSYLWLLIVLAAAIIPAVNFQKIVNLGGRRHDFFWSCLAVYAILAGAVSLCNMILYYTIDSPIFREKYFIGV